MTKKDLEAEIPKKPARAKKSTKPKAKESIPLLSINFSLEDSELLVRVAQLKTMDPETTVDILNQLDSIRSRISLELLEASTRNAYSRGLDAGRKDAGFEALCQNNKHTQTLN